MKKKIISAMAVGVSLATPLIGLAQELPPTGGIDEVSDFVVLLRTALGWINTIFYIVAAIFIIIAAFKYLTAQGDPEKVGEARQMVIYAVIGIAVALLATIIQTVVQNFLQVN